MACPYFSPVEVDREWRSHPRMPLGDPYTGLCRADPFRDWQPDQATLRQCCNPGYARQRCPHFPSAAGPDAHRFSVVSDSGGLLRLFYVAEQAHTPLAHGTIEYSTDRGQFVNGGAAPLLLRQAQAYIESYLRRKAEPDQHARDPHRR